MNMMQTTVALTALLVAGCAAYFSVYGIATLFSGAFIAVLIMAGALELGKLVATSVVYRNWNKFNKWLRTYLAIAVLALMLITSLGIFGFLSSAYQDSANKYNVFITKIENVEARQDLLNDERSDSKERLTILNNSRKQQEDRLNSITAQIGKTMTARSAKTLIEETQEGIKQTSKQATAQLPQPAH